MGEGGTHAFVVLILAESVLPSDKRHRLSETDAKEPGNAAQQWWWRSWGKGVGL